MSLSLLSPRRRSVVRGRRGRPSSGRRQDDLRFKKDGVKQVLKDVFLPWYHAYRLFVQCARAQLHQTGTAFAPDEKRALASKNIMDKWILAAVNDLVAFVRTEMAAYLNGL